MRGSRAARDALNAGSGIGVSAIEVRADAVAGYDGAAARTICSSASGGSSESAEGGCADEERGGSKRSGCAWSRTQVGLR